MRELFEFDDIKYRAQFVVKSDSSGFDLGGQYNDYVWKDGKKATREAEFLKLAYDGSLATDPLQYIDNPENCRLPWKVMRRSSARSIWRCDRLANAI